MLSFFLFLGGHSAQLMIPSLSPARYTRGKELKQIRLESSRESELGEKE